MAELYPIYYVEGDTGPDFRVDYNQDVTGWTFKMRVRLEKGGKLPEKTGTIEDASNGIVTFAWLAGELVKGEHSAEVEATPATGKAFTIPADGLFSIVVRQDLDQAT